MEKPDVITYRLGQDNYCYVNTPESFEDGILAAQVNFKELEDVDPSLINICVNGFAGGRAQHIRISPGAWSNVMTTLHRYEILDIVVESQVVPGTSIHSGEKGKQDPELPKYEDIHTPKEQPRKGLRLSGCLCM